MREKGCETVKRILTKLRFMIVELCSVNITEYGYCMVEFNEYASHFEKNFITRIL